MKSVRAAMPLLVGAGLALAAIPSASLAQSVPVYAETPADALARNVRILADNPKNFAALVAAGRAALQTGDPQAAAGFFGRASDLNPNSYLPQAGMGAALAGMGEPHMALTFFARAQQLGASAASFGADRGLAYDLLGNQAAAQRDYQAALSGTDADDARRRLALSLAISGQQSTALSTLQPLLMRGDPGAKRARAFILALGGNIGAAETALEYMMPGASARMDPFFRRLAALAPGQKAAAVHLGIFPESGVAIASTSPGEDRLASIDDLLRQPETTRDQSPAPNSYAVAVPAVAHPRPPRVQVASVSRKSITRAASPNNDLIQTQRVASSGGGKKIWLQLASGDNAGELPKEFRRIRARKPSLFTGLSGYVADTSSRARLLIGPFHSNEDARLFADALSSARIDAFAWTSQPGQVVRKLENQ